MRGSQCRRNIFQTRLLTIDPQWNTFILVWHKIKSVVTVRLWLIVCKISCLATAALLISVKSKYLLCCPMFLTGHSFLWPSCLISVYTNQPEEILTEIYTACSWSCYCSTGRTLFPLLYTNTTPILIILSATSDEEKTASKNAWASMRMRAGDYVSRRSVQLSVPSFGDICRFWKFTASSISRSKGITAPGRPTRRGKIIYGPLLEIWEGSLVNHKYVCSNQNGGYLYTKIQSHKDSLSLYYNY